MSDDLDEHELDLVHTLTAVISVRFALGCIEEIGTAEGIAHVMGKCIEGVFEDEHAHKWIAFSTGVAHLKGTPIPCVAHFEWATA